MGGVREGPHGVTGTRVVHGHAVREGVAHRAVGLAVVAAHLLRFPAGVLESQADHVNWVATHPAQSWLRPL